MKELILKYGLKRQGDNIQVTKNTEKAREEISTLQRNKQNIIDYLQKLEAETVEKVLNGELKIEFSARGVATIANYPEELDIFSSVIAARVAAIKEERKELEKARKELEEAARTGRPVQVRTEVTNASLDGCIVWAMPNGTIKRQYYKI